MLVTWKYRPRDTFIQRLDPRARLIMLAAMIVAFTQLWDLRVVVPLFGFALALYLLARIEWADIRRVWLFILVFVTLIVIANTILGARGGPTAVRNDTSSPALFEFGWVRITEPRRRRFSAVSNTRTRSSASSSISMSLSRIRRKTPEASTSQPGNR